MQDFLLRFLLINGKKVAMIKYLKSLENQKLRQDYLIFMLVIKEKNVSKSQTSIYYALMDKLRVGEECNGF
jgi:hypothetical protein